MAAAGLITFDELGAKLEALEEIWKTARREIAGLECRTERLLALERDRDALLESYAELMPETLDVLNPRSATASTTCCGLGCWRSRAARWRSAVPSERGSSFVKPRREGHVLAAHQEQGRGGRAGKGRLPHRRGGRPSERQRDAARWGLYASLLDNAMGLAVAALVGLRTATIGLDVHFLGAVREGRITCSAEVVHRTRRIATVEAKIRDGEGNLVAMGTGPFRIFEKMGNPIV